MANFNTHITVAAAGAGLLSVLCLQVGLVDARESLLLALLGTIGGILPDIDLQHTYASRILFALIGIIGAFLLVFSVGNQVSIVELWLIGIVTFLGIRFPVWYIFHQYTSHRGSWHSLAAAVLSMLVTSIFAEQVMGKSAFIAWLFGWFIFFGFMIHLLLDELYSVDFMNKRLKRSAGTAMKLLDWRKPYKSTALVASSVVAWTYTPDVTVFWDTFTSIETYQIIGSRFFPKSLF